MWKISGIYPPDKPREFREIDFLVDLSGYEQIYPDLLILWNTSIKLTPVHLQGDQ